MNFPRNNWFDVKLCGDGLGVYFLKWTYCWKARPEWQEFGLGISVDFSYGMPELHVFIGFLNIYAEVSSTYAEWPWNRKTK
jgi:hypothetical protein